MGVLNSRKKCDNFMKRAHYEVAWYLPTKKRPFAYSTVATRDLIEYLADSTYATIEQLQTQINYDPEAVAILQAYVDYGYGGWRLEEISEAAWNSR